MNNQINYIKREALALKEKFTNFSIDSKSNNQILRQLGEEGFVELGALTTEIIFGKRNIGKKIVSNYKKNKKQMELKQQISQFHRQALNLVHQLEREVQAINFQNQTRFYNSLITGLTSAKTAQRPITIINRILNLIKKIEDFPKKKEKSPKIIQTSTRDISRNNNRAQTLQSFLTSILRGDHPTLNSELIQILSTTKYESLWLEKKRNYDLSSEYKWLEFLRDIMGAANALTKLPVGIFIGIEDLTGDFVSSILPDEAEIRQQIQSKITPQVEFAIVPTQYPNNCQGNVIAIQPKEIVYSFRKDWKINHKLRAKKAEVWVRKGTRKSRMDEHETMEYVRQKILFFQE